MSGLESFGLREACNNLEECLEASYTLEEKTKYIEEHIKLMEETPAFFPRFRPDFQWLNVSQPLDLQTDLKGKIVVMDFFTYCCINCLHVLPHLRALEGKFSVESGLVVVGVHSAKFDNEKILENVKNAVLRNDIKHPVVNDPGALLWTELGIICWPTIIILGPNNEILFELIGERNCESLELLVSTTLSYYFSKNVISKHSLLFSSVKNLVNFQSLSFPSKISLNDDGTRIAVSDTGHHRILILTRSGKVLHYIGGMSSGMIDGDFEKARFSSPQGVAWVSSDIFYVADSENHAIREICIVTRTVRTIAGTGEMGNDKEGGKRGEEQALNSPWDLCIGSGVEGNEENVLYIAMAGHHQIWAFFLKDTTWFKNKKYLAGTCVAVAGTGNEENRNNSYPHRASFAQPSGLCFISDGDCGSLIVADSESSSIRMMSLQDGSIKGIVGGSKDPSNLFSFGDADGTGIQAKLQHPLGVVAHPDQRTIYACDSYNHKIKVVDVKSNACLTFAGCGKSGNKLTNSLLTSELNEPNGLSFCSETSEIFIADTNNHQIKVINIQDETIAQLNILWETEMTRVDGPVLPSHSKYQFEKHLDPVCVSQSGILQLILKLSLKDGYHLTPDAPQTWCLLSNGDEFFETENNQKFGNMSSWSDHLIIRIFPKTSNYNPLKIAFTVKIAVCVYFCSGNDKCFMQNILFRVPVIVSREAAKTCEAILSHCFSP